MMIHWGNYLPYRQNTAPGFYSIVYRVFGDGGAAPESSGIIWQYLARTKGRWGR